MDIDAVVQIPANQDDITEMVDEKKTVTITEMQEVRSMVFDTKILSQVVPEKQWGTVERTGKFL